MKGVVYKIPCSNCKMFYIGETGRTLAKRITEHKYAIRSMNLDNAIAKHCWNTGHQIDWDEAKVVAKEDHPTKRKKLESIKIKQLQENFNMDDGKYISPIWKSFI